MEKRNTHNFGAFNNAEFDINDSHEFLGQDFKDYQQLEIVPTSIKKYITGIYALNIPDEDGSIGDWHSNVFWRQKTDNSTTGISLGGEGHFDTNYIFGNLGVSDAYDRIKDIGIQIEEHIENVYVADHVRATLDLAFSELRQYGKIWTVRGSTKDWLNNEEQKSSLLQNALELKLFFKGEKLKELKDWIEYEKKLTY